MAPEFDDDVADLRGNAMADDVAPDDVCERVTLVALVSLVSSPFISTNLLEANRRITNQGVDRACKSNVVGRVLAWAHELRLDSCLADPVEIFDVDPSDASVRPVEHPVNTTRLGAEQDLERSRAPPPHRSRSNIASHLCARGEEDFDAFRGPVFT